MSPASVKTQPEIRLALLNTVAGMKVDVDFFNPMITGFKQQWQQLPEPVQEVLPYAGNVLKDTQYCS